MIEVSLFVAMVAATPEQPALQSIAPVPSERCEEFDKRSWKERIRQPISGVTLLPKFVSAMPRSEVEAINPLLVGAKPRGPVELIPGLRGRARAAFSDETDALLWLDLEGGNGHVALSSAVAYFGKPQFTQPLGSFVEKPAHITGGFGYEKTDNYRWCDEKRLVSLYIKGRNYTLRIEPR